MKSKFILSSAFIMTTMGAFGADAKITEASTCTVDVLGVSDNNAVANTIATWDVIEYTLNPGQYLNVTDTSVTETTCPAGSYCVGGGYTVETADNSIAQCPAEYPNSAEGAGADTQCYTACTVATANIAHATAVSGNDYYGTGTDTCEPTACVAGWHIEKIPVDGKQLRYSLEEAERLCNEKYHDFGACWKTNNIDFGNTEDRWFVKQSEYSKYIMDLESVYGISRCSDVVGNIDNNEYVDEIVENVNGKYCWKKITNINGYDVSSKWVFVESDNNINSPCSEWCSNAYIVLNIGGVLENLLDAVSIMPATCVANTINIDWNPDNGGDHIKNMCTYEGEITLPTPDPVKPGYTFTGWKLVE